MLAILVCPVVVAIVAAFVVRITWESDPRTQALLQVSTPTGQKYITATLIAGSWFPLYLGLLMVTTVVAETIPKDRQLGLGDLLDTLPLTPGIYLVGKVLSVYAGLLGILMGAMVAIGAVWWWVLGPFELGLYLQIWIVGAAPLVVLNSGLAVLLAANLTTGRQAAILGMMFAMLSVSTMFLTLPSPWLNAIGPARSSLLFYFLRLFFSLLFEAARAFMPTSMSTPMPNPPFSATGTVEYVWWTLGIGGAQLALAWLWAWLGRRRQEAHA